MLAFISADQVSSSRVTGIVGGGRTWVPVQRTNPQKGTAEIWRAFASSTVGAGQTLVHQYFPPFVTAGFAIR